MSLPWVERLLRAQAPGVVAAPLADAASRFRAADDLEQEAYAHELAAVVFDAVGERARRDDASQAWAECGQRLREARNMSRSGVSTQESVVEEAYALAELWGVADRLIL